MRRLALTAILLAQAAAGQSLRSLAAERNLRIGTAVEPSHLNEPAYAATLAREFNQVQPENSMKFGLVHPGPETYNFAPGDALIAFAQAHQMAVRGHTLVWHNQLPAWIKTGDRTPEQLSAILQDHIAKVVGHYAGKVYAWDVVNEAFDKDGTVRKYLWSSAPGIGLAGTGFIEQALRWAHAADDQAKLFYNDFSAEGMNAKSEAIYQMARDFKQRGVPLDGIGMQMHFSPNATPDASLEKMEANFKRLTDLGLEVQITELDVKLPDPATEAMLTAQANRYRDIVTLCLKNPHCTAIQTWGFTDRYSWIPHQNPGFGAALLFDRDYQPKPAYTAIQKAFLDTRR